MTSVKGQDRGQQKRQMKSASRLYAVQALFQMEVSGQTVEAVTRATMSGSVSRSWLSTVQMTCVSFW